MANEAQAKSVVQETKTDASACTRWDFTSDNGGTESAEMAPLSFPKVGDDTLGVHVNVKDTSSIGGQLNYVYVCSDALIIDVATAETVGGAAALEPLAAATEIFREDLDEGYVTVLVEMIAGAASSPALGEQVAARIAPWRAFAQGAIEATISDSPLASLVPVADAVYAVVALYLGLEMLSHLDGDRTPALALFDQASQLAAFFAGASGSSSEPKETR